MRVITLKELTDALGNSWCAETSASSDSWHNENPALGQCAVTSCVVQDYLGGDLLNCVVILPDGTTSSHYYNLIDNQEIDLTRQQFPAESSFSPGTTKTEGLASTRDYCLSYDKTRSRYELLKARVEQALEQL